MAINRIDSLGGPRLSTNATIPQQSQQSSFGQKVASGLERAGQGLATGAGIIGGAIPGASMVSAAISSAVTGLGGHGPSYAGSTGSSSYAATGVINVGGGSTGGGGINTTVGGSPGVGGAGAGGSVSGPNLMTGSGSNNVGSMNNELATSSAQNNEMLKVQIAMQRENTMFSSISNVLKTKHETAKNAIGNIR